MHISSHMKNLHDLTICATFMHLIVYMYNFDRSVGVTKLIFLQLLQDALSLVAETIAALPGSLQVEARLAARKIVGSSDDVVRKVWLVRWLHEL